MAPKNLLPVAVLCSALVGGTPLATWATPATANSLPQALNPVANSSGIVACKRFRSHTPRSEPRDAFTAIRSTR